MIELLKVTAKYVIESQRRISKTTVSKHCDSRKELFTLHEIKKREKIDT